MAIQFADSLRNLRLNQVEIDLGVSALLEGFTGPQPANCAAIDSGTKVFSMTLPADFFSDAAAGVKAKLGTWQDNSADAAGIAAHFRMKTSGGVCKVQGSIGDGSGGDLTLDNADLNVGQQVTVTAFALTDANP